MTKERVQQLTPGADLKWPFAGRAYGGFTRAQEEFYQTYLSEHTNGVVLDPMAGQGYSLSRAAHAGHTVCLGDISPAPLLLASLRDPRLIKRRKFVASAAIALISDMPTRRRRRRLSVIETWLSPAVLEDLRQLAGRLGLDSLPAPMSDDQRFWRVPLDVRLLAGLPVLGARDIVCYRRSDNLTWLKPGGMERATSLRESMLQAVDVWLSYAEGVASTMSRGGEIIVRRCDITKPLALDLPRPHIVITSPPYANRLDYSRLWAPELEVMAGMFDHSSREIQVTQLGSTVVAGQAAMSTPVHGLPASVRRAIKEISEDKTEFSATYYGPFFRRYANGLAFAMEQAANVCRPGGVIVVFVRDTVRKDVLFLASDVVRHSLVRVGCRSIDVEQRVIRGHIGLLRRASTNSVFGLAQREWWMAYRKA